MMLRPVLCHECFVYVMLDWRDVKVLQLDIKSIKFFFPAMLTMLVHSQHQCHIVNYVGLKPETIEPLNGSSPITCTC